jgi:hypothetical protein
MLRLENMLCGGIIAKQQETLFPFFETYAVCASH